MAEHIDPSRASEDASAGTSASTDDATDATRRNLELEVRRFAAGNPRVAQLAPSQAARSRLEARMTDEVLGSPDLAEVWHTVEQAQTREAQRKEANAGSGWVDAALLLPTMLAFAGTLIALIGPLWDQFSPWEAAWKTWNLRALGCFGLTFLFSGTWTWVENRRTDREKQAGLGDAKADLERRSSVFTELLESVVLPTVTSNEEDGDLRPVPAEPQPRDLDSGPDPTEAEPLDVSSQEVDPGMSSALRPRVDVDQLLETPAYRELLVHLARKGGTAVGLAGERGSGKSELIRASCANRATLEAGGTLGVVVPAPVAYEPLTFLRLVILRLARATPQRGERWGQRFRSNRLLRISLPVSIAGLASAGVWYAISEQPSWFSPWGLAAVCMLALGASAVGSMAWAIGTSQGSAARERVHTRAAAGAEARRVEQRIRYSETLKVSQELSFTASGLGSKITGGKDLAQVPLTEADLVDELADLIAGLSAAGYDVRIGIDELDKLEDDEEAAAFLNHIKVLFPITSASYVMSLSESAWSRFAARNLALRDAFDSSLDAVITVPPLTYLQSRELLHRREATLSERQTLFCHALSGGRPREFLRVCRQLVDYAGQEPDQRLDHLAPLVLAEMVREQARAARFRLQSLGSGDDVSRILDVLSSVIEGKDLAEMAASRDDLELGWQEAQDLADPDDVQRTAATVGAALRAADAFAELLADPPPLHSVDDDLVDLAEQLARERRQARSPLALPPPAARANGRTA